MNKLFKIFFLTLILINFTACGDSKSSNSSNGGRSSSSVFSMGGFIPSQYIGANGQITDVPGYCNYAWDYTYDQVIVGLVESYRMNYFDFDTIVKTEILNKTNNSYTERTTNTAMGSETVTTTTHNRDQDVQSCIDGLSNQDSRDLRDLDNLRFKVNIIAQRQESIRVQAGTYLADYSEVEGSMSIDDDGRTGTFNMHVKSWTGVEGLAEGRIIKMESDGSMQMDGEDFQMAWEMELLELYIR